MEIESSVTAPSAKRNYAVIIKRLSCLRELIKVCLEAASKAMREKEMVDPAVLGQETIKKIEKIITRLKDD